MDAIDIEKDLSWQFVPHVNEVCKPLFDTFGINYFDYARFYPDQTCIVLYSDPQWARCFLTDLRYKSPPAIITPGSYLWSSYIDPEILSVAKESYLHEHGITLLHDAGKYMQVMNFCAPPENEKVMQLYLNRPDLLRGFGNYFVDKLSDLITQLERRRLRLRMHQANQKYLEENILFDKCANFYDQIGLGGLAPQVIRLKLAADHYLEDQKITLRELECLNGLMDGQSAKVVGRTLDISYRTVEKHFDNLKMKFGVASRLELISKLHELVSKE